MTDEIKVITNHHARRVLSWQDLTAKEQAEFDYLDTDLAKDEACFIRYKGWTYDLREFESPPPSLAKSWDAFSADTFFSGILYRYLRDPHDGRDTDYVIMGRCYA